MRIVGNICLAARPECADSGVVWSGVRPLASWTRPRAGSSRLTPRTPQPRLVRNSTVSHIAASYLLQDCSAGIRISLREHSDVRRQKTITKIICKSKCTLKQTASDVLTTQIWCKISVKSVRNCIFLTKQTAAAELITNTIYWGSRCGKQWRHIEETLYLLKECELRAMKLHWTNQYFILFVTSACWLRWVACEGGSGRQTKLCLLKSEPLGQYSRNVREILHKITEW